MSAAHNENARAHTWRQAPERPRLSGDEVHVWLASLARHPVEIEALRGSLSAEELRRAERFRFARDRSKFIAARGILREILSRYLCLPPTLLSFGYNDFGKPELREADCESPIRFNLSHAGEIALYAIAAGREVGVDVELVREDVACAEIAAHFFSRREAAALLSLPANVQTRAFFNCWTRKEAYIKARGAGLSLPLDGFDVTLAPGEPAALLSTRDDEQEAARWSLTELFPGTGYTAALAVRAPAPTLRCWRWTAQA
jgi:4'-phosphopantetheinyl transferase